MTDDDILNNLKKTRVSKMTDEERGIYYRLKQKKTNDLYYAKNKDAIRLHCHNKYRSNIEAIRLYNKEYYQKNKEKKKKDNTIRKPRISKIETIKKIITCDFCKGSRFQQGSSFNHKHSKLHLKNVELYENRNKITI